MSGLVLLNFGEKSNMLVFPNAKINLGLDIVKKRQDGFHDLESIFLPIDLRDILEFVEADELSFSSTGIEIPGDPGQNLCLKAWEILECYHHIPKVKIHLHKQIPIGAGLGGGSADGAFMLKALNDQFELGCSVEELESYAAELGSDCAFFIKNVPAFAQGRGEVLEPIEWGFNKYAIALVNPGIHIGTAEAYSGVKPAFPSTSLMEAIKQPLSAWEGLVKNDFEKSIFKNHRDIASVKDKLYDMGAIYSAMSGSGSSVFGFFYELDLENLKEEFPSYSVWKTNVIR